MSEMCCKYFSLLVPQCNQQASETKIGGAQTLNWDALIGPTFLFRFLSLGFCKKGTRARGSKGSSRNHLLLWTFRASEMCRSALGAPNSSYSVENFTLNQHFINKMYEEKQELLSMAQHGTLPVIPSL